MRMPLFTTRFLCLLSVTTALFVGASPATAAPVEYTAQLAPNALPGTAKLAFDDDNITRFAATVRTPTCAGQPINTSANVYKVDWTGALPLAGGAFSITGRAASDYGQKWGADFVFAGQISQDHRSVTASLALSAGTNPFFTDCAGSWSVIAVPSSFQSDGWTIPLKRTYRGTDISFNYKSGVITSFSMIARAKCGASVHGAKVEGARIGLPSIQVSASGRFEIHSLVVDGYDSILQLDMVGRLTKSKASGTVSISEPPGGFTGVSEDPCGASYSWSAAPPKPVAPPGPAAFFSWLPIKATSPAGERYFFYVTSLSCSGRANAVRFTIAGRTSTVRCSRKGGWASRAVAPSRNYRARVQAVRIKRGRIVKRGRPRTEWVSMPGPNDNWSDEGLPDVGNPPL